MALVNRWRLTSDANDCAGSLNLTNNGGVLFDRMDGAKFSGSNSLTGTKTLPSVFTILLWLNSPSAMYEWMCWANSSGTGFTGLCWLSSNFSGVMNGATLTGSVPIKFPYARPIFNAMTFNGTTANVYVENAISYTGSATYGADTNFSLGKRGAYASYGFIANSCAKDSRIYDTALSDSSIAAIYAQGANPDLAFTLNSSISLPTNYTYDLGGRDIFTYDGSNYKYYRDGVQQLSNTNSHALFPLVNIGYNRNVPYVMCQSTAIDSTEALYRYRTGRIRNGAGVLLALNPNEIDANGIVRDKSGNGNWCQITGGIIRKVSI